MTEPALLVLEDDPSELEQLRGALGRRYGQEYVVLCENSAAAASDRLAELAGDVRPTARTRYVYSAITWPRLATTFTPPPPPPAWNPTG